MRHTHLPIWVGMAMTTSLYFFPEDIVETALNYIMISSIPWIVWFFYSLKEGTTDEKVSDTEILARGETKDNLKLGRCLFLLNCVVPMEEAEAAETEIRERFQDIWLPNHGIVRATMIARCQCLQIAVAVFFDTAVSAAAKIRKVIW